MQADIAVVGVGPSALLLAAAVSNKGMRTVCIGSDLRRRWTVAPEVWLGGSLDSIAQDCTEMAWAAPMIVSDEGGRVLDGRYARLDPVALQQHLERRCDRAGVQFLSGEVASLRQGRSSSSMILADGRELAVRRVVTTAAPAADGPVLSSLGQTLSVPGHPWFPGEILLADVRGRGEREVASFGQVMPLAHDVLFVREVSLAGPAVAHPARLRARLHRRLAAAGVRVSGVFSEQAATVALPRQLPDAERSLRAFGPAASMVHPLTGQHLAQAVERAPAAATALETGSVADFWQAVWPERERIRHAALAKVGRHLASLDQAGTAAFFDGFFSLPTDQWRGCLDGSSVADSVIDSVIALLVDSTHNLSSVPMPLLTAAGA